MAAIGVTEVDATRQDLIASIVQETLKTKMILAPTISDYSSFAGPGAKSVSVPRRTQFAAADKTENVDLLKQEITFSADKIDLTKHKAIFSELERIAEIQSNVSVEAEILKEMSAELALQLDKDIIVELKLASTAAPDHLLDYVDTVGNVIALEDIANARMLLNQQNVPMEDRFMVISPAKEKEMLGIANFISVEKYGSREALLNGEIGRVFGFKVMIHNELADVDSLFYHKSHVGWARSAGAEFKTDDNLANVAKQYLLNQIYGMEVLDSGKRGVYIDGAG